MSSDTTAGEFDLRENHPLRLRRARGLHITCTAGTLWITVSGDGADTFLTPGQTCQLGSNGLALIESLGDGRVQLERRPRRPWLPRWFDFHAAGRVSPANDAVHQD